MMPRMIAALAFVIVATMIGGGLGGLVGRLVGQSSPEFMATMAFGSPDRVIPGFRPHVFGMGVGMACGLFFGAGSGLLLAVVMALRDAWMARAGLIPRSNASGDPA